MATLTATQSNSYRPIAGLGSGAGAALVMLLAMGLLRLAFGLLTIPELMLNPILKVLGGQTFSDLLDRWYYAGRPLLFATILEGVLLVGALLGLAYASIARPNPNTGEQTALFRRPLGGVLYGLLLGVLLNVIFLPVVGQPMFAAAPAGLFSSSPVPLWLGLMLLALIFGVVLQLLLPRNTAAFYAASDDADVAATGDAVLNPGRRDFLRVLGGTGAALLGGALFAAGGTVLSQGGLQSPVDRNNPAGAPSSEPTSTSTPRPPNPTRPPTSTSTPRPTNTRVTTDTPVPPTAVPSATVTPTSAPTDTPLPTDTPVPPTETPTPVPTATPVPEIKVAEITPLDTFYHVSKNFFDPQPTVDTWRLEIKGLVDKPLTFTYSEIVAMPSVEAVVGMMCISNPVGGDLIGNTRWRGVRLADLLQKAGVRSGAVDLAMTAADGYTDSISYEKALDPDVVLVWEMDGAPLKNEHGYPLRLLVPGIYGMKHVKWITSIELVDYDFRGFWQQPDQGWSEPAPVNTMSKIDYPPAEDALPVGMHTLSGVAFAGDRSISRVEVTTDGGASWADAYVKPRLSETSWVVWAYNWAPPSAGQYIVKVRATDGQGNIQPARVTDPYSDGATGHHTRLYTIV